MFVKNMSQRYISIGFWNVRKSEASIEILADLVAEHELDVIALAESPISSGTLALSLTKATGAIFRPDVINVPNRITWAYKASVNAMAVFDGDKVSIREIKPALGESLLLCGIHAASRLARDLDELNVLIPRAAEAVLEAEQKQGHDRTVVFGDFNLSPFDQGLISSESFHGVMSRQTADRRERTVYEKSRKFFYNPMWKLLAADDAVCGTYHFSSNNPLEYFWYCYDQILFRPSLLPNLTDEPVLIVQNTKKYQLVDGRGMPSVSDHLPIISKMIFNAKRKKNEQ